MKAGGSSRKRVKVGSRVKFDFGGREVTGTVIEDRGALGVGGRRILRVRVALTDLDEPLEFEIPEAWLKSAA
jgi:primosomal protein N'